MGDGSGGSKRLVEELASHEEAAREAGVTMCVDIVDGQTFYGYFGVYDPVAPRLSLWSHVRGHMARWRSLLACYWGGHAWELAGDWETNVVERPFACTRNMLHPYEYTTSPIRIRCVHCSQRGYGCFRRSLGYDEWIHGPEAPEWELVSSWPYNGQPVTGGPSQEEIKAVLG